MKTIIERETSRLIMRQWQESDLDAFARMCRDPKVMAYFPSTLTKKESAKVAQRCQLLIEENGFGFWALEEKHTQQFIGFTGLHCVKENLPFAPAVEIGWRLSSDFWGNGYATEAANEALAVGFAVLNLEEIVSFAVQDNAASRAVMSRLGMKEDRHGFEHPDIAVDSHLRPHCLYRLSKSQWSASQ